MSVIRKELHWGRLISCYGCRPPTVWDMLDGSFKQSAEGLALVDGDTRLTYAELRDAALAAAQLLDERGIRSRDRVAVMLPNGIDAVIACIAVARLGAILVPLGTRLRSPEISYIFADAAPVAVIHDTDSAAEIDAADPQPTLRFDTAGSRWRSLFDARPHARLALPVVAEEDVFGILYTSGTTGRPKGAALTHFNVVHSCLHWRYVHGLTHDDRTALCVPWSHVAGLCGVLLPFLTVGATLVIVAEFKRRLFLQLAQQERITHALMVPAMYGLCLLEPDLARFDLQSWRIGAYGSAPMPEPTIERFARAVPQLQMCNCYGATETTSPATIMPLGEGTSRMDSVGLAVPCADIRVMDEAGHEMAPGHEGEIWIGGPMVIPGYWGNPDADGAAFAAGYWKSGDIGSVDADGYVRVVDRKKDMINRGGFKIYPAEVESVLTGLDGVVEAAVIGQPEAMLGEKVVAFLTVMDDTLTAGAVRAWCDARMADYKVPGDVVIGRDVLPRNANGKIQKAELRARLIALRENATAASG